MPLAICPCLFPVLGTTGAFLKIKKITHKVIGYRKMHNKICKATAKKHLKELHRISACSLTSLNPETNSLEKKLDDVIL